MFMRQLAGRAATEVNGRHGLFILCSLHILSAAGRQHAGFCVQFASVEDVSRDGSVEWVKAWGIEELKKSEYYKELLTHFGR
jgi:hypothetical protein